jgi:hypothetical protein
MSGWAQLDGLHGRLGSEHDASMGHYRIRLGPIKLFWKRTGGWEITFRNDSNGAEIGLMVRFRDDKTRYN